jgi:hypothetical protein
MVLFSSRDADAHPPSIENRFTAGSNAVAEGVPEVTTEGLHKAAQLWAATQATLLSLDAHTQLRIALDRFADSYVRRDPADKALDLAVCLEALLGKRDTRAQAKQIASRATALIVSAEPTLDRGDAQQSIERLYEARNAVVHGEGANLEVGLVLRWKDLVRQALRGYLTSVAPTHDRSHTQ